MMKIKNAGTRRIRLDRDLFILAGEMQTVSNSIGKWAVKAHTDIIDITPKLRLKPKIKIEPKLEYEVKKYDIK